MSEPRADAQPYIPRASGTYLGLLNGPTLFAYMGTESPCLNLWSAASAHPARSKVTMAARISAAPAARDRLAPPFGDEVAITSSFSHPLTGHDAVIRSQQRPNSS